MDIGIASQLYSNITIPDSFGCLGRVYNCTSENPADADIAGIGVMVSFFVTAILVFVAILIGYFKRSLPGIHTNEVDDYIFRLLKLRNIDNSRAVILEKRKESFRSFILSLSDQQLVTGLAILVTGFSKCDISIYSFNVVSAIAWFSCTTHLATLTVLRR
ncbi:hypothetical protein K432DRAFT_312208 [Lepidopterella palustris CBS 459.81]|uniref:Uncharacterized protein n=1 Tax=Lepidopterella palustris CBS 459.81 TaxID=1314670 RepID=A0A8E2J8V6_9PEZI|nr:hypothetical protein K432DRAFT_312208 [Lepidopterella palustris CBS 459.81]